MRLTSVMSWTFVGIVAGVLTLGTIGFTALSHYIEQDYVVLQAQAQADQAAQVVHFLEYDLAQGASLPKLTQRLQQQLASMPSTANDFLCLLDTHGTVVSHPNSQVIGRSMAKLQFAPLDGTTSAPLGRRFKRGQHGAGIVNAQPCHGGLQVVYQQPVAGTPWVVSIHSGLHHLRDRVRDFRAMIVWVAAPLGLGLLIIGMGATRWAVGALERKRSSVSLQESEARYRCLVEGSVQGLLIHCDGLTQFVNAAAARLFGYERVEELVGQDYRLVAAPEEYARLEHYRQSRLRGEEVPSVYECRGLKKDGTLIWFECGVSQVT